MYRYRLHIKHNKGVRNLEEKIRILLERSNKLFELTKKEMDKYYYERRRLVEFSENKNRNIQKWEEFIKNFEKLIEK